MKELEYLSKQAKYSLIAPSPKQAISVKPETILAIAEAFRSLEQDNLRLKSVINTEANRAEAAEAESAKRKEEAIKAHEESDVVLAKLAELEKQEPIGMVVGKLGAGLRVQCYFMPGTINLGDELFTRPAPAINLPELVLDENDNPQGFTDWYEHHFATQPYKGALHVTDCENAWRAAILRHIEEAG